MPDHHLPSRPRRFQNPNGANGQPFWKAPAMLLERSARWPSHVPVLPRHPRRPVGDAEMVITFVGHATFLIETSGGAVITDPVFAERASPVSFAGPRRVRQPGVRLEDLPPITMVLLSHNHYDHCDLRALRQLDERCAPTFVTLIGNAPLLRSAGIVRVEELDWWDASTTAPVPVWATPAQHFSARTPFDRNRALWGGFVMEAGPHRLFFCGDSGYGPHFRDIGARLGPFDAALLPIGAYEPRWFMKDIHMNPAEAVQAHLDVGSRLSIGMHFGTFQLTTEDINEPVAALARARDATGMSADRFRVLEVGESLTLTPPPSPDD